MCCGVPQRVLGPCTRKILLALQACGALWHHGKNVWSLSGVPGTELLGSLGIKGDKSDRISVHPNEVTQQTRAGRQKDHSRSLDLSVPLRPPLGREGGLGVELITNGQ